MKILIAPGAFKHSLKATDAADAIIRGLRRSGLAAEYIALPIADGGNSTLDVLLAAHAPNAQRQRVTVRDPLGRPVIAEYGLIDDAKTAVIEMALASGLELLQPDELDPLRASTYGTGQLMAHALKLGATRFIMGMGGSATVDGGSGCLLALGAKYTDKNGRACLQQGGGALSHIQHVDLSGLDARWAACEVRVLVDVDNPALGEQGAAAVFGAQKGAQPPDIPILEAGLAQFLNALAAASGTPTHTLKGGGAAGAFAAGLVSGLGATLVSGADYVLDTLRFDEHLTDAALVVTGEGRMDAQSIGGKGPFGVALRAAQKGVPTVALVGGLGVDDAVLHAAGMGAVLPIVPAPLPLADALQHAPEFLEQAAVRLGHLLQLRGI